MIDIHNYPKDLVSYLLEMRKELDKFQDLIREVVPTLAKGEYFGWFLKNNEPTQISDILFRTVEMLNKNDTETARKETFKKHIDTMNVFYNLAFDITFRI